MAAGKKYRAGGDDVYVIHVRGDKTKQLEPSEHRIHFPGGYIGVTRTSEGEYWAHVGINREFDGDTEKDPGRLTGARLDVSGKSTSAAVLGDLANPDLEHLAIRVALSDTWQRDGLPASYGKGVPAKK
jgi:hypothetical protein